MFFAARGEREQRLARGLGRAATTRTHAWQVRDRPSLAVCVEVGDLRT